MKRLKFRFYDKLEKEMVYSNKSCLSEFFNDYDNSVPNAEMMQFAGLFDKQGVEIYEGDIVKEPYYVDEDNGFLLLEVIFDNGEFLGKVLSNDNFGLQRLTMYREVIGNIYENKELLEDKQ